MLATYELVIDPEKGYVVNAVAAVDIPAIERNWMAFEKQLGFSSVEDEKRIVVGAAMIPDMKIYRKDDKEEYNVVFSKETISQIAEEFYKNNFQQNFNLMHKDDKEGVVFFMSFIRDSERGLIGLQGDYPDGTWFLGAKINNDEVWDKVKSGEIKGFSVEGLFGFKKPELTPEEVFSKIQALLSGTNI